MNGEGPNLSKIFREILGGLVEAKFKMGDHELVVKKSGVAPGGIICPGCGCDMKEKDKFCAQCGKSK